MAMSYPPATGFYLREPWQDSLDFHKESEFSSITFDGISLPESSGHFADFTIEMMVKFVSYDGRYDFLSIRSSVPSSGQSSDYYNGFSMYVDDTNITVEGDGASLLAPSPALGQWAHIALVYDKSAGKMILYVDATEGGSYTKSSHDPEDSQPLRSNRKGLPADAELANFRLWDNARSATQLSQDMATAYPADEPGLIASIPLDEPSHFVQFAEQGAESAVAIFNTRIKVSGPVAEAPKVTTRSLDLTPTVRELSLQSEPEEVFQGQISGTVTVKGDPAAQRVMAFNRKTGKKVAETTSASDGTYTLTGLDPSAAHYVVALDQNLEYNGVIADNITPEVPA